MRCNEMSGAPITRSALLAVSLIATAIVGAAGAVAQTFDGVTIIEFADRNGHKAIAGGEHIVTFVSARGSYGAVVARKGTHGGCQSLAAPGSYTGSSIAFGLAAEVATRKHRLQTYCSPFTLRFETPGTVRIEAPGDPATKREAYAATLKVIAHIPLRAVDFQSRAFARHDLKGIKLGPVLDREGLGPLTVPSSADRYKGLNKQVGAGKTRTTVRGRAAAAEVTQWPWDALYFAQVFEQLEQTSTWEAFESAVHERYGKPSALYEQSGYMLWAYDLDGRMLAFDKAGSDACRATIDFWAKSDPLKRIHGLDWEFNSFDIGPWGCSMFMELNPNRSSGGVTGYQIRAASGYVMAINHFLQRVAETTELLGKVEALRRNKPKL